MLKAVVAAAVKVPAVNASFAGDAIIQYGSVNLSVAVAVEDGLVTPVIRDAQKKSLREISEAVKDLATRARGKKLKPEEYAGGTITVSNLGSYGIDSFCAIINPPQAMILAIGAIVKKPVVNANERDRRRPAHEHRPERRSSRGRWRGRRDLLRRAEEAHRRARPRCSSEAVATPRSEVELRNALVPEAVLPDVTAFDTNAATARSLLPPPPAPAAFGAAGGPVSPRLLLRHALLPGLPLLRLR